ncbi:hypothetical protein AVEN_139054-1 [Araneus ventricosus]|uniref:Uncharacterized protein n=1 Tax=Araneus ventricosus TaxID=182803 RepID=A0A4Y2MQS4_ARAVE|nr:hypothetical protein AVEN_139054-1 [Araneus ventricosus]
MGHFASRSCAWRQRYKLPKNGTVPFKTGRTVTLVKESVWFVDSVSCTCLRNPTKLTASKSMETIDVSRRNVTTKLEGWLAFHLRYCSATDSETTTFGLFYTGKGCQAMSHMSAFPEFFVRSRSVKCKHHPSILHSPYFDENNSARRMRKSEKGFRIRC